MDFIFIIYTLYYDVRPTNSERIMQNEFEAAFKNNAITVDEVRALFENSKIHDLNNPLKLAIEHYNVAALNHLLWLIEHENERSPRAAREPSATPPPNFKADINGNIEISMFDLQTTQSLLSFAALKGNRFAVLSLIENGADIDQAKKFISALQQKTQTDSSFTSEKKATAKDGCENALNIINTQALSYSQTQTKMEDAALPAVSSELPQSRPLNNKIDESNLQEFLKQLDALRQQVVDDKKISVNNRLPLLDTIDSLVSVTNTLRDEPKDISFFIASGNKLLSNENVTLFTKLDSPYYDLYKSIFTTLHTICNQFSTFFGMELEKANPLAKKLLGWSHFFPLPQASYKDQITNLGKKYNEVADEHGVKKTR